MMKNESTPTLGLETPLKFGGNLSTVKRIELLNFNPFALRKAETL